MKNIFRGVLALLMLAAPSMMSAQTTDVTTSVGSPAGGLNPGDQIRIIVWRKPEFSGDFPVAANGTITHPLYKEVQVTGVPLSVVEDRLRAFLTRFETNPQFVIQPLVRIIVGGEVRTPNVYSVPPETTIAQAIALAGGPTDRGELRKVDVIRDKQGIKFDVSKPESDAGILQIRSGDQVIVGRKRTPALQVIGPISSTIAAIAAITTIIRR
jgi:polysaccharide export outer membrane protein